MRSEFSWREQVRTRVAKLGLHPTAESDLIEELTEHLESQYAELAPQVGAEVARAQLLAELGDRQLDEAGSLLKKRETVESDRVLVTSAFWNDITYALRSLRRMPATLFTGATALALGIGLSAVMFSVIYGLTIKGLPYSDADRIAWVMRADPAGRGRDDLVPFADFARYQSAQHSFESFGGYARTTVNVSGAREAERANVARVTSEFLDVTGVKPMLGRGFQKSDNDVGAPPTVVLSHAMWRDQYSSDSSAVGRSLNLNGRPYTIIGVMPEQFVFPMRERLWVSLQLNAAQFQTGEGLGLSLVGKLRDDVEFETANADLASISRQLATENADTAAVRDRAKPYVQGMLPSRVYALLYAMFAAVTLVLLVACTNVANLLLDRVSHRARESAIRVALGASRAAIFRLTLIEAGVVATYASVMGVVLAQTGIALFNRYTGQFLSDAPFWMDIQLHVPVLAFIVAVSALSSLVSGVVPAMFASRADPGTALKSGSQQTTPRPLARIGSAFVILEIALSSALLVTAGFVTTSIIRINNINPGFRTDGIISARMTALPRDSVINRQRFEEIERAIATTPGVSSVYLGTGIPGTGWGGGRVAVEGKTYENPRSMPGVRALAVTPSFFTTFEARAIKGRTINSSDREGALRVAVVNEEFVRREFPDRDPIGQRIRMSGESDPEWMTIVGVVPNMYADSPDGNWPPAVLTSFWQERQFTNAAVAITGDPSSANIATLRRVMAQVAPDVPLSDAATMRELMDRATGPNRIFGGMFVTFAIVGLALAAIGLYAIVSMSVGRRTRELGIRLALGATHGNVIGIICRQGMLQSAIGIAIGFAAGLALTQLGRAALFGVDPGDPLVMLCVGGVLVATTLVASLVPARRAIGVDPARVLRAE